MKFIEDINTIDEDNFHLLPKQAENENFEHVPTHMENKGYKH